MPRISTKNLTIKVILAATKLLHRRSSMKLSPGLPNESSWISLLNQTRLLLSFLLPSAQTDRWSLATHFQLTTQQAIWRLTLRPGKLKTPEHRFKSGLRNLMQLSSWTNSFRCRTTRQFHEVVTEVALTLNMLLIQELPRLMIVPKSKSQPTIQVSTRSYPTIHSISSQNAITWSIIAPKTLTSSTTHKKSYLVTWSQLSQACYKQN